jgi:lipopolysaccharide transport system ATP-binding protein
MKSVLDLKGVGKRYKLGQISSTRLAEEARQWIKGKREEENDVWALKEITFKVEPGEVVGIIGKNGAGKSTLLKLLSRVTAPSRGEIKIRGRIASLLEVGTGFHPELTGRENIYLNGAILGMTRREMDRKLDEIVAFSGVERYLGTPVKRYSSGMYVRLAFAVAAHLEPDILVVDEVLAVGDADFQRKCIGKLNEVSKLDGRTVLFVSHNLASVKQLCTRGILLETGRLVADGGIQDVLSQYQNRTAGLSAYVADEKGPLMAESGFALWSARIIPAVGQIFSTENGLLFEVDFQIHEGNYTVDVTFELRDSEGVVVFHTGCDVVPQKEANLGLVRNRVSGKLAGGILNSGIYFLTLIFGKNRRELVFKWEDALQVELILDPNDQMPIQKPGILRPVLNYEIEPLK